MAYTHQTGWTAPSGRQIKSARAEIDDEALELFKSVVTEKAAFYERTFVAAMAKAFVEQIKVAKMAAAVARYKHSKSPYKSRNISHRRRGLVY
jgi:hypothetical protein